MQDKAAKNKKDIMDERLEKMADEGWLRGDEHRSKVSLRIKIFSMCISLVVMAIVLYAFLGVTQFRRFAALITESGREQDEIISQKTSEVCGIRRRGYRR